MLDALKPLLDSDLINEETRSEISEAWEAKMTEAREQVRAELREEFAQRYEHDKTVMVEALDRMVTEGLTAEISAVAAEKQALAEDRVKFQSKMKESATKFNDFMVTKLAEEIGELRKDRQQHSQGLEKLEKFVVQALAGEIMEFAQDRRDVVETRVRLVREARGKLESLKARFERKCSQDEPLCSQASPGRTQPIARRHQDRSREQFWSSHIRSIRCGIWCYTLERERSSTRTQSHGSRQKPSVGRSHPDARESQSSRGV